MKDNTGNLRFVVVIRLASCIAMALTTHAIAQDFTWHVDDDAEVGGTGLNWQSPFDSLQTALEFAALAGSDLIKVAQGEYKPSVPYCPNCDPGEITDRHKTFLIDFNEVTIEGGYAGIGAPDPDDRDVEQYETILSGLLFGIVHSYHVVTVSQVDQTVVVDGLTLTQGRAEDLGHTYGGGILIDRATPHLVLCTLLNNTAGSGGGMYLTGPETGTDQATLTNCTFIGNVVTDNGGGMYNIAEARPTLLNCLLRDNTADNGGAIFNAGGIDGGSPTLINCTITANVAANDGSGEGGGIRNDAQGSEVTVVNSIVWGNTDDSGTGTSAQISGGVIVTVTYSCIQDDNPGDGKVPFDPTNIDLDPRFVDPDNGDYRLQRCSPCVDTGNPDEDVIPEDQFDVDEDLDTTERTPDLDLNTRILVVGGNVDMGAYEFVPLVPPLSCPADLDGPGGVPDGVVDGWDLTFLMAAWGPCPDPPPCCPADLDGPGGVPDGVVDGWDLTFLMAAWGPYPESGGGEGGDGGGGDSEAALEAAVMQLGFESVAACQTWLTAASDGEAFACGCILLALLAEHDD